MQTEKSKEGSKVRLEVLFCFNFFYYHFFSHKETSNTDLSNLHPCFVPGFKYKVFVFNAFTEALIFPLNFSG